MAHIASVNQSKLSDNAVLHYYVGPAPYHQQGILLFNPKTNQTIVRRSFKQIDNKDPQISPSQFQSSSNDVPTHSNDQASSQFPMFNSPEVNFGT